MQTDASIIPWLDFMRQLIPPAGLVLIGAGTGTNPWVQYLQDKGYPGVVLVEADESKFQHLKRVTSRNNEWSLHNRLIAPHEGPAIFHHASHSRESGLLRPETLRELWPNLTTRGEQTLEALGLERLLRDIPPTVNWLIVNCLPALSIVESAGTALDGINVIVARVLLGEFPQADDKATLASLQTALEGRGFRIISKETGRHPGLGYGLFIRDPQYVGKEQQIQQMQAELDDLRQQKQAELDELRQHMRMQNEEVARAEGQIALLKEMLLQDDVV